jgi:hypothetical protein
MALAMSLLEIWFLCWVKAQGVLCPPLSIGPLISERLASECEPHRRLHATGWDGSPENCARNGERM